MLRRENRAAAGRSGRADPSLVAEVRAGLGSRTDLLSVSDEVRRVSGAHGTVLGPAAFAQTVEDVSAEILGAGALQRYLDDPEVCDVLVNAPDEVWVEREGRLVQTQVDLGGPAQVRALAVRLAALAGRRLDDASPTVDAQLPDGTRLHAVLPPLAGRCTAISLRVPRRRPLSMGELVRARTVAPVVARILGDLMDRRANLVVSGATGAGKTTLLAALVGLVDHAQRVVVIEEHPELVIDHPHVVGLVARAANVEGVGEVGLAELVRNALRMRPDRIVLGECRGAEVREVLAAMNTGHDGSCTTVHANSAGDVAARLEALGALAGMGRDVVASQAVGALDQAVHLRRHGGRRYVAQIGVVGRASDGTLTVEPALDVSPDGQARRGPAWSRLADRLGPGDPFDEQRRRPGEVVPLRPRAIS